MLKFNRQAEEWLEGEVLSKTVVSDDQMNRIIESQSPWGLECRLMLARYFLMREPKYREFDELNGKLHGSQTK